MHPDFSAFFHALWGHDPFPWQSMLAERVAEGGWPKALDLPTASSKTACMDIGVYAFASQAGRTRAERTAPRRIWFVLDRRIIVDQERRSGARDRETASSRIREAAQKRFVLTPPGPAEDLDVGLANYGDPI